MNQWPIKTALFVNYFIFAILLNSVGTVILQVQNSYGVAQSSAAVLEAFKDLSIAIASFLLASWVSRIGYKRASAGSWSRTSCFPKPHPSRQAVPGRRDSRIASRNSGPCCRDRRTR